MTTRTLRGAAACALLASTALASPALAQSVSSAHYNDRDANGVDLVRGDFRLEFEEGSIGSGPARLALVRTGASLKATDWDAVTFSKVNGASTTTITIGLPGGRVDRFTGSMLATSYNSAYGTGGMLAGSGGDYVYTLADGTKITFADPLGPDIPSNFCSPSTAANQSCELLPTEIRQPNGSTITLQFDIWQLSLGSYEKRLAKVENSFGYSITFLYQAANSLIRTGAQFRSTAGGPNPVASVGYAYPNGINGGKVEVTDTANQKWEVTATSVKKPGQTSASLQASGSTNVTSVQKDGVTTSYARVVSGNTATMTITDALGKATVVTSNLAIGRPTSIKDPLNRTTSFTYDTLGRLTRVTKPEGNLVEYTLDGRGNVTQERQVAKPGSGNTDIITAASFDATCANPVKCNKPNSITDARQNVTDFTYDATHGGVLTVTAPAPTAGAVRPQTRYTYAQTSGVSLLTAVSQCQTQASCTGTADEVKATVGYDPAGNVTTSSEGNGNGTLTATSAMTYDAKGDVLTLDGPLAGPADTTRFRYDAARRLVGTVSPDPDGTETLKHRAVKNSYGVAGNLLSTERGTVNSQSDADWALFASLERIDTGYDANLRPISQKLSSGATTYTLTHLSYDAAGRPECSAVRMNKALFDSLAASACLPGTEGGEGPDRITKAVYDNAGQVLQVRVAVGTSEEAAERSMTYSDNGQLATLTDAENNRTTYEYDGHDRLGRTRYPVATRGANASSATDFEEIYQDAAGNVTQRVLRDGQSIFFGYDNLNRVTVKNLPGSEPDVSYGYDNLGRLTSATQPGSALSFTYDALSRRVTETGPLGTVSSAWDVAGRRTRLTYPGTGLFVDYDYLVTGEMTRMRENGATSGVGVLASFFYDDLGRRTSLARGNGVTTFYAYDPVSRLAGMTLDLPGTSNDLNIGSIAYNPASQIVRQVRSNDLYSWTGHFKENKAGVPNGLNQLTSYGSKMLSHNAKGNVTVYGSKSFSYSSENLLVGSNGVTLAYDPLLRLERVAGGTTTRMLYDGLDRVAEYDGSAALQRRYVFGPDVDEPIVWYEGSGTANRRFLSADERGTVVAVSDDLGAVVQFNRYDEFGQPQSSNLGKWGYTGQGWLSETGAWYFKARVYEPELGRFLQPDPIGYGDGFNLYSYTQNDPINMSDPTGRCGTTIEIWYDDKNNNHKRDPDEPPIETNVLDGGSCGSGSGRGGSGLISGGGGRTRQPRETNDEEIVVTAKRQQNAQQCLAAVGRAGLKGFIEPESVAFGLGKSIYEARERIGEGDYGPRRDGTRFPRDWRHATKLGIRRFIPGYIQASVLVGAVNATFELFRNPACGLRY